MPLTQREIDAARYTLTGSPDGKFWPRQVLWDSPDDSPSGRKAVSGLGLRVFPSGMKRYVLSYRTAHGRKRLLTIKAGTLERARVLARAELDKVAAGKDPVEDRRKIQSAPTVADLHERFMKDHVASRAESTQRLYETIYRHHVGPAWGSRKVTEITWEAVSTLHREIAAGGRIVKGRPAPPAPVMANRILSYVGKAWSMATKWEWWPRTVPNPGREHDKEPEHPRGQALSAVQLRKLGKALALEPESPTKAAFLVYLLTGARPSEVCGLRWADLEQDGRVVRLPKAKTGPRAVYLAEAAAKIIAEQPRKGEHVFQSERGDGPIHDLRPVWDAVAGELDASVRLYDAGRHTFTTWAQSRVGLEESTVRILTGHAAGSDAHSRYVHPPADVLLPKADLVARHLLAALRGEKAPGADVIEFRHREVAG